MAEDEPYLRKELRPMRRATSTSEGFNSEREAQTRQGFRQSGAGGISFASCGADFRFVCLWPQRSSQGVIQQPEPRFIVHVIL